MSFQGSINILKGKGKQLMKLSLNLVYIRVRQIFWLIEEN